MMGNARKLVLTAVLLAIGFIIIPVILFLSGDPNAVAGPGGH